MIFSFSDLLEAPFLGSVSRTKKKPEISIFIMSIDDEKNLLWDPTGKLACVQIIIGVTLTPNLVYPPQPKLPMAQI